MTEAAVSCAALSKRYGTHVALNHLTVEIPKGRMVGVFGPNGAGKSTLFRVLTGLVRTGSGQVTVLGSAPGWRTNAAIAYLPDRARWYSNHTVDDALHWGRTLLPGFDYGSAVRIAESMGLELASRVYGLSRGTEARLMLTLCLARQVPLMILDEPLAGIDMISREQIIAALVESMTEQEKTILISTHEIYEAESLFDYAVFLHGGQVVREGDTDALRSQHGSIRDMMRELYGGREDAR
jgi:ABC-2 type transport system ATP-binding protein